MTDQPTEDFRAGYEAGKRDAIHRCFMERVSTAVPDWRSHNAALGLAVIAIRALNVPTVKEEIDDG